MTRPFVEPTIPTPQGAREPLSVPQHTHAGTETFAMAGIAVDLMERMEVDCLLVGSHTHITPDVDEATQTSKANSTPHHHHDLTCLVQAGRNEVQPFLQSAQESSERWYRRFDGQRAINERLRQSQASTEAHLARATKARASMNRFMRSMPAVGPWATLADQYDHWLMEEAEEAAEAQESHV